MAKFIFCITPHRGHIQPTLAIVQELVARGHEVMYFTIEKYRSLVQNAGATSYVYVSDPNTDDSPAPALSECFFILPQVMKAMHAFQPACVIYERSCVWGKLLARIAKVQTVMLYTDYAANEKFNSFKYVSEKLIAGNFSLIVRDTLKKISKLYNVPLIDPFELYFGAEKLNFIFMPRAFHPEQETFSDQQFKFIGPALYSPSVDTTMPPEQFLSSGVTYVSFGTVSNSIAGYYDICLSALRHRSRRVVMALGATSPIDPKIFGPLPENILIYKNVPQLEVLRYTTEFITHGGMNSVMEALSLGIPLLVIPFQGEQTFTARHIEALKLGIGLSTSSLTSYELTSVLERLENDPLYRLQAEKMQDSIKNAGGAKKAVDDLHSYIGQTANVEVGMN